MTAGLNVMVSGIPWWTSDIGGFFDADVTSDDFRELLVRWFQFGVFWPVVRLHGNRHPDFFGSGIFSSGGPNEVWSFGDDTYEVLRGLLFFRERLRPYLAAQLDLTARSGLPPVRPLWFDRPDDADVVDVDDQFLVGPDLLVAPVVDRGVVRRDVVLPRGSRWRDVMTGQEHDGGRRITVDAPRHIVPMLVRVGGGLSIGPDWFDPLTPDRAAGV